MGLASENKTIHTKPSPLHSKLGCLLFSTSSLTSDTPLHINGMGKEKIHFSLLELAKCQKGPLGKSVSTNFVTTVANNSQVHQNIPFVNLKTQLFSKGQKLIFIIAFQE